MCTLTAIVGLVGTAVSAVGAIQQAKAAAASARYNAKVAKVNTQIANNQAEDAIKRGQSAEQQQRYKVAQILGKQQASMAANGVDMTWGSPLDTLIDTATMGELDALTVRQNAARESYDYRVRAMNSDAQGTLYKMEARSALTGGYLSALGTVLGGVGTAYKSYSEQTA